MTAPLLIDLSHTCHTRARTGVQRVARSIYRALGGSALVITHDPFAQTWRRIAAWERANLSAEAAAAKRKSQWPLHARLRSRGSRLLRRSPRPLPPSAGVLVPEIFSPVVAAALPQLFRETTGPRVALFHDAIALKLPEFTPAKTVARFPGYLLELLAFDGIAAVSEDSRATLLDYWSWAGVANPPPVQTIPLAIEPLYRLPHDYWQTLNGLAPAAGTQRADLPPVVLSVGSIEGRKNHLALLDACEQLWTHGARFTLHLIGLAHPQTGAAALERIQRLQATRRPLRYEGPVDDAALGRAYAACSFTVYPSLMEGFGLPVLESLIHGKPCICSAHGALGESARGGGCIALPGMNATALASAIERLLRDPGESARLAAAARARRFRTWSHYANELIGWMSALQRRV
jgi:glycosyltransferase involved in cell wall biosynthesis